MLNPNQIEPSLVYQWLECSFVAFMLMLTLYLRFKQRLTPITNQAKLQAYAQDTLEGLQYIHSQGIIHADLKLQNLLVDRPSPEEKAQGELPRVKVCDFGLAHLREPAKDGKSTMVTRCGT